MSDSYFATVIEMTMSQRNFELISYFNILYGSSCSKHSSNSSDISNRSSLNRKDEPNDKDHFSFSSSDIDEPITNSDEVTTRKNHSPRHSAVPLPKSIIVNQQPRKLRGGIFEYDMKVDN